MAVDRRRVALVVALVALVGVVAASLVLVLRGPSGSDAPVAVPSRTQPAPSGTTAEPSEPVRAPLTGEVVPDPSALQHPAVAVKVSDVRQAHPQAGIEHADLVFVEPIGVAYTRLAAVFHSDVPGRVGPVRSARPADAALLAPLQPVFGHTMAASWVMNYLGDVDALDMLGSLQAADPDAYVRDPSRPRPDDVFADPRVLLDESDRTAAPEPYFRHATDLASSTAASSGSPGTTVTIPYGSGWQVRWTYDAGSGTYLRGEPWGAHRTESGAQVAAANVVVIEVETVTQKLAPGEGAPVPVQQLVDGSGSFVALSGGHAVRGTWRKGAVEDPFELTTDAGEPLLLAPGRTWVELPGSGTAVAVG